MRGETEPGEGSTLDRRENPAPDSVRRTSLEDYWNRIASRADEDPLAAVCHPGAPRWLNRFFAHFQERAVAQDLAGVLFEGSRALDVGCGIGRWTRWLSDRGADVIGVDPTEGLLAVARRLSPALDFRRMSATALDLPDASFDLAVSVTVLQHLLREEQDLAMAEIVRVLRPGGTLFVLDLIDRHDVGHMVHPRAPGDWIRAYAAHGLEPLGWAGQEYVPLLRFVARATAVVGGRPIEREVPFFERQARSPLRWASHAALWLAIQLSYPLEYASEALLPAAWARHGRFRFRKSP